MKDFKTILYESILVAFGKVLAKYNVFAQGYILKDVGKEILEHLNSHGLEFEDKDNLDDLLVLIRLFVENGFAEEVDIQPADKGLNYIWKGLYGLDAYKELFDIGGNPFLSCPLNLCLYYLADKHGKTIILHRKSFDMDKRTSESQYELVDKDIPNGQAFDPLVLENAALYELAHQREQQFWHQAITDPLTGISNRRHLVEEGTRAFLRAQLDNLSLSFLMLDIDHFKKINDTYGHSTGDVAICTLAEICRKSVRAMDLTGRIGGEEFVIVLPDTPLSGATGLAERLRRTVEGLNLQADDGSSFTMTVSIGVTAYDGTSNTFEDMLCRADIALYQAKESGRNRVVVFEPTFVPQNVI